MGSHLCAHLCAFGTTVVWGLTFISTKVLMNHGSTPLEVLFFRFVLALAVMYCMKPKIFRHGRGWKEELLFLGAGASGITVYFCFENTALTLTYASNVSLIICTAPFLTGLAAHFFLKEALHGNFFTGFLVAITGIACISFNGAAYLNLNPAGDLVQLPNMSVLELDPGSSPAGITDKLIIDATTPVAPDNRGHYSQPVVDLPETKAWAEKLTAMLAARK